MTELPLIARAIAHADRVAIESGGQCYTYKDLMEGSAAVASALLETADDLAEARIGFFDSTRL